MLFYWVGGGEKGFAEVRFVLQVGTFCLETPEHFVLRIIVISALSESLHNVYIDYYEDEDGDYWLNGNLEDYI